MLRPSIHATAWWVSSFVAIMAALSHAAQTSTSSKHDVRAALLDGVDRLPVTGVPGALCVYGDDAVAIVVGESDKRPAVFAAASTLGRGRLVGLGHNGNFSAEPLREPGMSRFAANVAHWAAGGGSKAKARAVLIGFPSLKPVLESAGHAVTEPKADKLIAALQQADVAFLDSDAIAGHAREVETYVRRGGGLVTAIPGWGWQQLNPGKSITTDFGPNKVFSKAGIVWTDLTLGQDGSFRVDQAPPALINASDALEFLNTLAITDPDELTKEQKDRAALAGKQVLAAVRSIPAQDPIFLPRLRRAVAGVADRIPTEQRPVRAAHGLARVAVSMSTDKAMSAPVERIEPSSAAQQFPGSVPAAAPRLKRTVEIDSTVPGWHSTGLYAPPGQLLRVALPESATDAKLQLQIGAHTDHLWHHDEWKRIPQITRSFRLDSASVGVANAFGGLVYVVAPNDARAGKIPVVIENAVEAPLFVLGKTGIDEWRKTIRYHSAPWGEIASEKLIITVPSERLRDLDDPDALMRWWDTVLDAQADLATLPRDRKRPERVVVDVQISAGWLHAGYPIMGHLVHGREAVDLATLSTKGSWGYFHELGHNHQEPAWNFENTGEVTVNLFSLYCFDKLLPDLPAAQRHPGVKQEDVRKRLRAYRADNQKFPKWDLFTGLLMYRQLERGFGWEAYKKVFAEYRDLPARDRPRTDADKRDQWMVRFSRAVGYNLGPFFEWWAVPTSPAARESIKDLPVWMPPELNEDAEVSSAAGNQR